MEQIENIQLLTPYALFILLTFSLGLLIVFSKIRVWIKTVFVAFFAVIVLMQFFIHTELLGRPKPVVLEYLKGYNKDPTILSFHLEEGKAIYLVLQFEHGAEPRLYMLPWDMKTARQLREAAEEAKKKGQRLRFRMRGKTDRREHKSLEKRKKFYLPPIEAAPPKRVPQHKPREFVPPVTPEGT